LRHYIPELFEHTEAEGIDISVSFSPGNLVIYTDSRYLTMQLNNLMSNALVHANSTVEVQVSLTGKDNLASTVSIMIDDDGNGIAHSDRENVVKPFWRGRSHPVVKGHGMGLAIVARIADWLKADLVIRKSEELGGASIGLLFSRE